MSFEPTIEKLKTSGLKRLCVHQAVVEARLLASGGVLISKVLSIVADCTSSMGEVFTAEARYSGRVNFKVAFVDTEGNNHCMNYNADFTDKLLCPSIHGGLRPNVSSIILDTDIVAVDEREIKLACVVETALDASVTEEHTALVDASDGIYLEKKDIEFSRLVIENYPSFALTETVALQNSTVLFSEARMITHKRIASFDSVILEGNILCDLILSDSEGMIFSQQHIFPFKEEFAAEGVRDESFVIAGANLSSHRVTVETDGEKFSVSIEFEATASIRAFATARQAVVVDCFSVSNELEMTKTQVAVTEHKLCGNITERVEGSVTLDVSMPIADSILAVTASKLHIANATATDGRIVYDGVVSSNIIYWAVEQNTKHSVAVELPFSIGVNNSLAREGDTVFARGIVSGMHTRIVRGSEIQIKADIEAEVIAMATVSSEAIAELRLGEERPLSTSAFSVHIGKAGENLWDIAKALGTTPESVMGQNPGVAMPLGGGERLLCYRQKR
ncbi:MAG: DUF3794 domain-containing protein [Firmicutes bacterium]|nr:DUF3794 domain-containing protein [Bacillota bacterium]